ncbi:MAG: phosphoadenosine phosphosulfate reductase family protein [Candidatus Bathyarchaeota archaeon]|nr:MAG: phosphoadenosine phosphosulfate reductase family protein [Candidatus Bathyarchaeota archaeon]
MPKLEDHLFRIKVQKSKQILMNAIEKNRSKIAAIWTAGRDSTCLLYLMKEIYGKVPVPVFLCDTSFHFKETYEYRDKIAKVLRLHLMNARSESTYHEEKDDQEFCSYMHKLKPVLRAMEKQRLKALILPTRWSEQKAFLERCIQETSRSKMRLPFEVIEPIIHWTREDIMRFIEKGKVPLHPLYARGYQSVSCEKCKFRSLEEREDYDVKDAEKIIERLQSLGYF